MKKVYLIAVVFALLAGFATYMFATQIDKKSTIKDADTVAVVIALQDIPKNTIITDAMFAEDAGYFYIKNDVIAADATPAPITEYSQITGKIAAVDIYAGEQMNEHKFISSDDENVGLSFKLSPGKKAYSFGAGSTNGVDGYISAGDTVDIIIYSEDSNGKSTSKVAYSNLKVIRVSSASAQSEDNKITSYGTLTVEVTEKQALQLYKIERENTFKLVLNSRQDELKGNGGAEAENAESTTAAADAQN